MTKVDPADWNLDDLPEFSQPADPLHRSVAPSTTADTSSQTASPSSMSQLDDEPEPIVFQAIEEQLGSKRNDSKVVSERNKADEKNRTQRRQIIILASIGVIGCLLATLAFLAFVRLVGTGRDSGLANNPGGLNNPKTGELEEKNPKIPSIPILEPEEKEETSSRVEGTDNPSEVTSANPVSTNPTAPGDAATNTSTEASNLENKTPNAEIEKTAGEANSPKVDEPVPDELPSIFKEWQVRFDRSSQPLMDDVGSQQRQMELELDKENSDILFADSFHPNPIPVPKWDDNSTRKMSLKFTGQSILKCINFFSKSTGTGIYVDWLSCKVANIDLDAPVEWEGADVAMGDALQQICAKHELVVAVDAEGFPYVHADLERIQKSLPDDWSVSTLLSGEKELPAAVQILKLLNLSDVCEFDGKKFVWNERANAGQKAQLAAVLVQLADAMEREVPAAFKGKTSQFDFTMPKVWSKVLERCNKPLSLDTLVTEPRAIIDTLNSGAQAGDLHLIVNWPQAWGHGFHPSTSALTIVRGRSLDGLAYRVLEDYSLELVPLDSRAIMLTHEVARRSYSVLVALRTDRGMNAEDIKNELTILAPIGPDRRSTYKVATMEGNDSIVFVRISPPSLSILRDEATQKALGLAGTQPDQR